jgi:hypothetical protein
MKTKIYKGIVKLIDVPELKAGLQVIHNINGKNKIGKLGDFLPNTSCWPIYYLDGSKSEFVMLQDTTKQLVVEYDEPTPEGLTNHTIQKMMLLRSSDWQYALDRNLANSERQVGFVIRKLETPNIIDFAGSDSAPIYEEIEVSVLTGPPWDKVASQLYVGSKPEDDYIDWVIEEMSKKFYPPVPLK